MLSSSLPCHIIYPSRSPARLLTDAVGRLGVALAGLPLSARSASIYSCAAAILQPAMTEAETLPSPARIVLLALHMRATELGKTFTTRRRHFLRSTIIRIVIMNHRAR